MKSVNRELEQMNGVDPYEDEIEDGLPGWFYGFMILILFVFGWMLNR